MFGLGAVVWVERLGASNCYLRVERSSRAVWSWVTLVEVLPNGGIGAEMGGLVGQLRWGGDKARGIAILRFWCTDMGLH